MACYFIQCNLTGRVKIGFSADVAARIGKIHADSPGGVRLLGSENGGVDREAELHTLFAGHRVRGEWFNGAPEIVDYAAGLPRVEKVRFGGFDATALSNQQICSATGLSRSYVSQMRSGERPITLGIAVTVWAATGVKVGPIKSLDDGDITIAAKLAALPPYFSTTEQGEAA